MNSQDFLIFNLIGATAFAVWYLISKRGVQRPTQLNMRAEETAPPLLPPEKPVQGYQPRKSRVPRPEKSLNVFFVYNGHSWDAYEVLGVPAGSALNMVTEAYQKEILRCDKGSIEFFEAAYKTILNKQ